MEPILIEPIARAHSLLIKCWSCSLDSTVGMHADLGSPCPGRWETQSCEIVGNELSGRSFDDANISFRWVWISSFVPGKGQWPIIVQWPIRYRSWFGERCGNCRMLNRMIRKCCVFCGMLSKAFLTGE